MKLKVGKCPLCNDGVDKELVSGKCKFHYWSGVKLKSNKKTGGIKKVAKSQGKRLYRYRKKKDVYLEEHPYCEANVAGCNRVCESIEVHHGSGRIGDNLFKDFVAVGRRCHNWCEANPEEAKRLGISKNRIT